MKTELTIANMTCGHCLAKVEKSIQQFSGVESARVDLIEGTCEVLHKEEVDLDKVSQKLGDLGYPVTEIRKQ
jgi:copper chaperone CopZ